MKLINAIHKFDVYLFIWYINTSTRMTLARICRYISKSGDGPLYCLLFLYWYSRYDWSHPLVQTVLLGFAIERPSYFILKNGFKRNRPANALVNFKSLVIPSDHFSFPSGHTSAAFMMATAVGYFFPQLLVIGYLWAGMIGFSRVTLGVHFPTDILIGALLGGISALVALEIVI
ncbi:MAG: phosphatase PAP2 family protein [Gammaproteobacteria bacterium]